MGPRKIKKKNQRVRLDFHFLSRLTSHGLTHLSSITLFYMYLTTRMVVHGQLVEPTVCLSDLYDVFLLDIVRDTRQNLWTMIYRSQ